MQTIFYVFNGYTWLFKTNKKIFSFFDIFIKSRLHIMGETGYYHCVNSRVLFLLSEALSIKHSLIMHHMCFQCRPAVQNLV